MIKKTVSEKVQEANHKNAQRSTGPRTAAGKIAVSANAIKHGLLARRLIFQSDEEKAEFTAFLDQLKCDFKPVGILEYMIIEEMATNWWKLQTALDWEQQGIQNRADVTRRILKVFKEQSEQASLSFSEEPDLSSAARQGWDCRELVIRSSSRRNDQEAGLSEDEKTVKNGTMDFEAKLGSSIETILRYQTGVRRDFFRALEALERLQRKRLEASTAAAGGQPPRRGAA